MKLLVYADEEGRVNDLHRGEKLKITLQGKNRISSVNLSTSVAFLNEQKEERKAEVEEREAILIQLLPKEDKDKKTSLNFHFWGV